MVTSNKINCNDAINIVKYSKEYKEYFVRLNLDWIEEYFTVEAMDVKHLQAPEENIIAKGGEIFFVVENQCVKGTCALVNHGLSTYEIAKMAVNKNDRGRGFGRLLIKAALDCAREKGGQKVIVVSNTLLEPAINLYKKYGFKITRLGLDPNYERGNIEMALELN